MKCSTLNVSTGPVQISKQVQQALADTPISHRSTEFQRLYNSTTDLLCTQFNVRNAYVITGSGTAANEAMVWRIKTIGGKGLILSNGEFGERLTEQANRASLEFIKYELAWGAAFDLGTLQKQVRENGISWVLFCHCETSTGVLNDLDSISKICSQNNCLCFVDCMSTVGTTPLELSTVAMATASSGKGLASIPGLAIVLSNVEIHTSHQTPAYFDLAIHDQKHGIPYTLSSNLLSALHVATKQKLQNHQFQLAQHYSDLCYDLLNKNEVLAFNNTHSKVFTVAQPCIPITDLINRFAQQSITVSSESIYLKRKNWLQIALLGYYQEFQLIRLVKTLPRSFPALLHEKSHKFSP